MADVQDVALTDKQAAETLGVCTLTVRRLMSRGELASFLVGRARRIWLSEVRAYTHRSQEREIAEKAIELSRSKASESSKPAA
jgi:excisionase family DNA binding protein